MVLQWSTDSVPEARRFELWREACCQHVYALTPERRERTPFRGAIRQQGLGPLDLAHIACDGHLVQRRAQDIRDQPSDTYYLYVQRQGRAWFEQQGRRCEADAGDIVIADPNQRFSTGAEGRFDFGLWRLDRARLNGRLRRSSDEVPMLKIGRGSAEHALISTWLDTLVQQHARLSTAGLDMAVDTLCHLVAHVVDGTPDLDPPGREARRQAVLRRVMHQVEQRAADPSLTPTRLAGELGMSLRTLHQLFASGDCSVHEFLVRTRLARAHALLLDPGARHLSVTQIGHAVGFAEVSTFYRRFRQRYGRAPGDLRER